MIRRITIYKIVSSLAYTSAIVYFYILPLKQYPDKPLPLSRKPDLV